MTCGLLIPSLGGPQLERCLAAVAALDPAPDRVLVVLSGSQPDVDLTELGAAGVEILRVAERLGFAAAVNTGLAAMPEVELVALLNDDAIPTPHWLRPLQAALAGDAGLAAVQGTISDAGGERIDGRGIALDRYGLAVQVDRGQAVAPEPPEQEHRPLLAVSGTAALLRRRALHEAALPGGAVLDPSFGSYYEDLDLGLRLARLGWGAACIGGAPCRHLGSLTGSRLRWRHPWWLLANRWRALAGNLTPAALLRAAPRLLRGELRAVRTLVRSSWRAIPVAVVVALSLPLLIARGWLRRSPGTRLGSLDQCRADGGVPGGAA